MHSSRMRTARSSSHLLGAGGVCLSACWHTPGPGPIHPPLPLGVGLETPPGQTPHPPWAWAFRPLPGQTPNLPPGCGPGDSPQPDPPNPPGVGLETPSQTPQPPPPRCGSGDPPLWTERHL